MPEVDWDEIERPIDYYHHPEPLDMDVFRKMQEEKREIP